MFAMQRGFQTSCILHNVYTLYLLQGARKRVKYADIPRRSIAYSVCVPKCPTDNVYSPQNGSNNNQEKQK